MFIINGCFTINQVELFCPKKRTFARNIKFVKYGMNYRSYLNGEEQFIKLVRFNFLKVQTLDISNMQYVNYSFEIDYGLAFLRFLPSTLLRVILPNEFNQPLENVLPPSLTSLTLGNLINHWRMYYH